MEALNLWLAVVGGLTLVLGLFAGLLQSRAYVLSDPMVATLVGVAVGPYGLAVLRLSWVGDPLAVLEQVARLTVAIAVMSIALRLPDEYFWRQRRALSALLLAGMTGMWLASGLLAHLILDVPVWVGLLVGAVVTPTDPVIANTIVTGGTAAENIPTRLRNLISAEAGANDGGAYPFVFLAILVLSHPLETAAVEWVTETLLWEVLGAVAIGAVVGAAAGYAERWTDRQEFLDETSVLTVTVALTFTVLGAVKLLSSDGVLAVFAAGFAYSVLVDPAHEVQEQRFQEVVNRLFTVPGFVVFGMALPWSAWFALGWSGAALVVGVLLLRRIPVVLALRSALGPIERTRDTLFVGWFGPIGLAAVFYATLAARRTGDRRVWVVASLLVAGSVVAHGATATPLTLRFGRAEREENGDGRDDSENGDGSDGGEADDGAVTGQPCSLDPRNPPP
ncbi:sodium:proton exchanger [Halostella sp. JP-L12]|uniref:cation:proton antiporter domain-containing protein n=1 Tax=Halostella TaxID=1843185 RepID=UPI000EF7C711|nr:MULTISPECIES: cation:proton antiporter [Halostella]NHN48275.1 sodium:proton exchanger [Halostella sp. JP-L12]